jgi:hypothetical protein
VGEPDVKNLYRRLRGWHPPHDVTEAEAARLRAELRLARTKQETAYYAELGASLKEIREANHLTELFYSNRAPRGRHP